MPTGALWLAGLAWLLPAFSAGAVNVVVLLRNGDRITGELVAQQTNHVIIQTSWAGKLSLPVPTIGGLRTVSGEDLLRAADVPAAAALPAPRAEVVTAAKPKTTPPPPAAKPQPKRLRHNLQLGSNLMFGARDQQVLFARVKSSYERPYEYDPKKFFRTSADYSADYGETENIRSANRMTGSLKTDFDLGTRSYCYNLASGGYDEIRKIDLRYEIGPGMGYHLIKHPAFEFDVEAGLNYQLQYQSTGGKPDSIYVRAAEDTTWRLNSRFSLTKKFEFFVNGEDPEQFRFRLDATASYRLIENLSLNLTVLDQYDTAPAPKVDQNEVQIRSTIGITF
jgi:putative salt-induced outer membrane protein YdiY